MFPLNYNGLPKEVRCECCSPRLMTATASTGHKWTKEEIEQYIVELARSVSYADWFSRGSRLEALRHWVGKLDRYRDASEEFDLLK